MSLKGVIYRNYRGKSVIIHYILEEGNGLSNNIK